MGKPGVRANSGVDLGEDADKCCFAIDIQLGVTIIGILIVAYAVQIALDIIKFLGVDLGYTLLSCACCAPLLIAGFYFIKYFMDMAK